MSSAWFICRTQHRRHLSSSRDCRHNFKWPSICWMACLIHNFYLFNLFQPFSTFINLFQPLSTFFNLFQPFLTFFNLFQSFSTLFNLFQPFSIFFNLYQPFSTFFNLFQPLLGHDIRVILNSTCSISCCVDCRVYTSCLLVNTIWEINVQSSLALMIS